jgi:hypothetical protein
LLVRHIGHPQRWLGSQAVTKGAFLRHRWMIDGLNMNMQTEETPLILNSSRPFRPLVWQGTEALNPLEAE